MKKQLKIKLLPNGEIQIETIGIKGKKCLEYANIIKGIVRAKTIKENLTEEYYEQEDYLNTDYSNNINNNNIT